MRNSIVLLVLVIVGCLHCQVIRIPQDQPSLFDALTNSTSANIQILVTGVVNIDQSTLIAFPQTTDLLIESQSTQPATFRCGPNTIFLQASNLATFTMRGIIVENCTLNSTFGTLHISQVSSNVILDSVQFRNIEGGTGIDGVAVHISNAFNVTISNSVVEGNTASNSSVVFAQGIGRDVHIINCRFHSNIGDFGVVDIRDTLIIDFDSVQFVNNSGNIRLTTAGDGIFKIQNSNIDSNTIADVIDHGIVECNHQGASQPPILNTQNSNFRDNLGSAIASIECAQQLRNVTFIGNTGNLGGAILHLSAQTFELTNGLFQQNRATEGGAIYAFSNSLPDFGKLPLRFTTSKFLNNNATFRGGAIFIHNFVGEIQNSTVNASRASNGAGIYLEGSSSLNLVFFSAAENLLKDFSGHGAGILCNTSTNAAVNLVSPSIRLNGRVGTGQPNDLFDAGCLTGSSATCIWSFVNTKSESASQICANANCQRDACTVCGGNNACVGCDVIPYSTLGTVIYDCPNVPGQTGVYCPLPGAAPPACPTGILTPALIGVIVGIVAGVLAIAIIAVIGVVCAVKYKKRFGMSQREYETFKKFVQKGQKVSGVVLQEEIGRGNFGEVFKGKWDGVDVAVKKLKREHVADMEKEVEILKTLNHPNVVRYLGATAISGEIGMVFEFMPKGSLDKVLAKVTLTPQQRLWIMQDAASGMKYLHDHNIIHRDLAARNLLVTFADDRYTAKLADFGLSKYLENDSYYSAEDKAVPVRWVSPEVATKSKYSFKGDVWSYGVVMWEIESGGERPYAALNNMETLAFVKKGGRLERPKDTPEALYGIMMSCWDEDASLRPEFEIIVDKLNKLLSNYSPSSALQSPTATTTTTNTATTNGDITLTVDYSPPQIIDEYNKTA